MGNSGDIDKQGVSFFVRGTFGTDGMGEMHKTSETFGTHETPETLTIRCHLSIQNFCYAV